MTDTDNTIRWGILGTARIAEKVGRAIQQAQGAELVAIASRSADRAARWAADHNGLRSYGSYAELVEAPDIDAVYMPLPPHLHLEWTKRCAEQGKHVLSEKPIATSRSEAQEMWDVCRHHGVQLMDGVMWLHHPRAARMRQVIRAGELGTMRRVTSAFTFNWDPIPESDIRLRREMAGGSLYDLGWYCVGAALWAFDAIPTRVFGTARWYNEVDMHFSALLWFAEDRTAAFDSGFDTETRRWLEIAGTKASLFCDDFTNPWDPQEPRFCLKNRRGLFAEHSCEPVLQEVRMIEDFCEIVRSGRLEPRWPEAAIATQHVCDALEQSARSGRIVEL